MADGLLGFADGEVRLGNDILPGILVSQSVSDAVRFDEAEQDGLSGKVKVPMGWEDAEFSLTLDLLTDADSDCYDKLTELNAIFRGIDNGANPRVYTVTNRHARARGIDQVVFSGLDSAEDDKNDVIRATLTFVEHLPPIMRQENQVAATDQAAGDGNAPTVAAAEPAADAAVMEDPDDALSAGFVQGIS